MALERETIGFWEKLMRFKDKHGYWNLTKLVLFVAFSIASFKFFTIKLQFYILKLFIIKQFFNVFL